MSGTKRICSSRSSYFSGRDIGMRLVVGHAGL